MALDIELYRRTLYLPAGHQTKTQELRQVSVIDIEPEGTTRTLVFIHGYGGSAEQWLYQLRFFGQKVRVIAPDLRGHGLTEDPKGLPYSMNGLVDDLEAVLNALAAQRPFDLIAHSFGGAVATEYALRHPEDVRKLVLIGVPTRFIVHPTLRRLIDIIPDPLFSWTAKKIGVALFARQHALKHMLHTIMAPWRGNERLQELRVPTLVILGQRDRVFLRQDYEAVPRVIPGARQVVIPVSAHLVQLERPDAVNRAIRRFLLAERKLESRAPSQKLNRTPPTLANHPTASSTVAEKPWLQHYDNDVPEQLPLPKQPLHDLLSNTAATFPDRPALIFFEQHISYRELDRLSNRFAHALQALGIRKGDRVAIVLPNVPQCVVAFYGTLKAGAVVMLGSPLSNEEEISYQLQDSGARVLVTLTSYRTGIERICEATDIRDVIYTDVREYLPVRHRVLIASKIRDAEETEAEEEAQRSAVGASHSVPSSSSSLPAAKKRYREGYFQSLLHKHPPTPFDSGVTSDDLALLQYTSGTTDIPKGAMLSHGNLVVNVAQVRHWMPDAQRGREVVLCALPLSHIYGVTDCMNLPIALGGSILLLPTTRTHEILKTIKHHHPTIFPAVPALYLAIANYPRVRSYGISSIRICVSGAAPLPVEVQEAFEKLTRGRLVEGYGLTEASPVTHSNPLKGERHVGSIGIPLPGTSASIVDVRTGEFLSAGEVGELLIQGPQVMQGYWNLPEETAQTLRDGWLHTGDLARMDEDGFFTIIDRKKDLILSGSYNVYPRDVEEVLYEHPKVLEAAVVAAPSITEANSDAGAQEITPDTSVATASPFIKAVVVLKRGEQATPNELLAFCRERLDAYKVPRQIEFRKELPKNFVGKVLRRLLIDVS